MRFSITYLFLALAFALMAVSAPVPEAESQSLEIRAPLDVDASSSEADLEKRGSYSGKATWYDAGLGACGGYNKGSDKIVALNKSQYKGSHCGKWVSIKNTSNGKTVKAQVRDMCPGCGYGSLDLSKGAFQSLGKLDTGVLKVSWSFA